MKRIVLAAMFFLLTLASISEARTVTMSWDPNPPEENVTGYVVYYGLSSRSEVEFTSYDVEVDVGNVTQHSVNLPNETSDYFFAVVAYNGYGLRSDYSEEVVSSVEGGEKEEYLHFTVWNGPTSITVFGIDVDYGISEYASIPKTTAEEGISFQSGGDGYNYLMVDSPTMTEIRRMDGGGEVVQTFYLPHNNVWWPVSYSRMPDGTGYILWDSLTCARLWTVDSNLSMVSYKDFPHNSSWHLRTYSRMPDGTGYLMWDSATLARMWVTGPTFQMTSYVDFPHNSNWWVSGYHRLLNGRGFFQWSSAALNRVWAVNETFQMSHYYDISE